jgi:hypothetical protein
MPCNADAYKAEWVFLTDCTYTSPKFKRNVRANEEDVLDANAHELSEYEKERLQRIADNKAFMKLHGLDAR